METVPCIRLDELTDEQRRAYALAHNKTAELSDWNFDLLESELAQISDIDMTAFGFEIKGEEPETREDDYAPPVIEEPNAKPGDIYQLGRHRLMCGDSTDAEAVKTLIAGTAMDLVVTDPPYNVSLGSNKGRALRPSEAREIHRRTDGLVIENDSWENTEDFIQFLVKAYSNILLALKPGGAFYIWYASNQEHSFQEAAQRAGLVVRQTLIWVKSAFALGRQDYQWKHEPCLYGWAPGAAHYFTDDRTLPTVVEQEEPDFKKMKKDELIELLERIADLPSTIIREKKPGRSELHPTMKPIGLLAHLIKNSSQQGENVLDLFGGSGSTMIACEQLNRNCYMMELDPHFVDVIIDRWEQFTGQKAILITTPQNNQEGQNV